MTSSSSYGTNEITLQFSLSRSLRGGFAGRRPPSTRRQAGWPCRSFRRRHLFDVSFGEPGGHARCLIGSNIRDGCRFTPLPSVRARRSSLNCPVSKGSVKSRSWGTGSRDPPSSQSEKTSGKRAGHCCLRTFARRSKPTPPTYRRARSMGQVQAFQIGDNDQLYDADSYRDVVLAYRSGFRSPATHGSPVMFKDIGEAVEGLENEKIADGNGKPAVILKVQRRPGEHYPSGGLDHRRRFCPKSRNRPPKHSASPWPATAPSRSAPRSLKFSTHWRSQSVL